MSRVSLLLFFSLLLFWLAITQEFRYVIAEILNHPTNHYNHHHPARQQQQQQQQQQQHHPESNGTKPTNHAPTYRTKTANHENENTGSRVSSSSSTTKQQPQQPSHRHPSAPPSEYDYVIQSNFVKLRVSIRNPNVLHNVPSCQYTISQIELLSLVCVPSR
jgi:hypothetical protein